MRADHDRPLSPAPSFAGASAGRKGALRRRGRSTAFCTGERTGRTVRGRLEPSGSRARQDHHLLQKGLHPAHDAVPGPLPLLHLRQATRETRPAVPHPGRGRGHRRDGAKAWVQGSIVHTGDKPEDRYPVARKWLAERGYHSTLDYLRAVSIKVIEETGLLPHLNPGVMTWEDMARLKHVSASMGIMLETTSNRLSEKGGPHFGSPDKVPALRLRTIEDAGRLSIPFTTGVLIGIGETPRERAESLF